MRFGIAFKNWTSNMIYRIKFDNTIANILNEAGYRTTQEKFKVWPAGLSAQIIKESKSAGLSAESAAFSGFILYFSESTDISQSEKDRLIGCASIRALKDGIDSRIIDAILSEAGYSNEASTTTFDAAKESSIELEKEAVRNPQLDRKREEVKKAEARKRKQDRKRDKQRLRDAYEQSTQNPFKSIKSTPSVNVGQSTKHSNSDISYKPFFIVLVIGLVVFIFDKAYKNRKDSSTKNTPRELVASDQKKSDVLNAPQKKTKDLEKPTIVPFVTTRYWGDERIAYKDEHFSHTFSCEELESPIFKGKNFPKGLYITEGGTIFGRPTQTGSFELQIQASKGNYNSIWETFALIVKPSRQKSNVTLPSKPPVIIQNPSWQDKEYRPSIQKNNNLKSFDKLSGFKVIQFFNSSYGKTIVLEGDHFNYRFSGSYEFRNELNNKLLATGDYSRADIYLAFTNVKNFVTENTLMKASISITPTKKRRTSLFGD